VAVFPVRVKAFLNTVLLLTICSLRRTGLGACVVQIFCSTVWQRAKHATLRPRCWRSLYSWFTPEPARSPAASGAAMAQLNQLPISNRYPWT